VRENHILYFRPSAEARGQVNVRVADGRWGGIWNVEPDSFELYDVREDPGETVDLAARRPEVARRLRASAERWMETRPKLEGAGPQESSPVFENLARDARERLRSLGYIQ
jgi:arylsulfatase A-like enzyme